MYLLPINGIIGEDFKINDLLLHLNAAKNEQVVKLIFNSPGGYLDEADKMVEALKKENKIYHSTNSGDVASSAVELFLVSPKENRTFDTTKGNFLIHMPFLDPVDGGATGTAEEIQAVADEMKKLEKKLSVNYQKATGTSANILTGFMKENIPLTEEQIQQLGFATIIKPATLKAVAYFKNNNKMENKEIVEKLGVFETLLNKVMNLIKPKNLMIQDTNGKELDFGPDIQDASQIAVGVKATVDGQPAQGDFILADGSTLKFEAGVLTEIVPSANDELAAAKTKIADLESKLAAKETEFENYKTQAKSQISNVSAEFKKFKAQFSSGDEKDDGTITDAGKSKHLISKDELKKKFNL